MGVSLRVFPITEIVKEIYATGFIQRINDEKDLLSVLNVHQRREIATRTLRAATAAGKNELSMNSESPAAAHVRHKPVCGSGSGDF